MPSSDIPQIILLLGNYMNAYGPNSSHCQGFKIEFLSKLHNTRTADNKTTLMQYLAAFLEQKAPEVADFSITLESIPNASKGLCCLQPTA